MYRNARLVQSLNVFEDFGQRLDAPIDVIMPFKVHPEQAAARNQFSTAETFFCAGEVRSRRFVE